LGEDSIGLLIQLIERGAILSWALTTRLANIHDATVAPRTVATVGAEWEDARLLREHAGDEGFDLPAPSLKAELAAALMSRRTVRSLSAAPLSLCDLSTLL